jgi:sec-independent protein translocase protein TatC
MVLPGSGNGKNLRGNRRHAKLKKVFAIPNLFSVAFGPELNFSFREIGTNFASGIMSDSLPAHSEEEPEDEMSFLDHLEALRWHILRSLAAVILLMIVAFFSKKILFHDIILAPSRTDFWTYRMMCRLSVWLEQPFLCVEKLQFIIQSRTLTGQFTTHIGVSFAAGLIVGFPYVFWEIWRFVKPGLYPKERRMTRGAVFFVSLLFFLGISFGYWILAPLSINFLANYQIDVSIQNEVDLLSYIETLMMMVLACGLMFQLPMVILVLAKGGLVTAAFLKTYRRHAVLVIVVISAILTPSPDMFSQIIVALPIYLLYEMSIVLAARVERQAALENL